MAKEKNTYLERLEATEWQSKRIEIIRRDGNKCRNCESEENLQVRHTVYYSGRQPGQYENYELITLCRNCHLDAENELEKIKFLTIKLQQYCPSNLEKVRVLMQRYLTPMDLYNFQKMEFKHG